jgi:glycosyltransferase involved in cell wall biosynthesis
LSPSSLHIYKKPLVIGPMNGNMNYPEGYSDYEKWHERFMVKLARKLAPLANRLSPGKHHASVLLVANKRTRDTLDFLDHPNISTLVENGVDLQLFHTPEANDQGIKGRLRLVYMGRMPKLKALDISLKAVAQARAKGCDVEFDILGDGSERAALEAQTAELGLTEHVRFHGFLPQNQCADILRNSDALILNSVRECGGAVVLEAMSIGLPIIAADWGGPADYVDSSCGILVHPMPRKTFADRLADAMETLAQDPALRKKMGATGLQKVREQFDWNKKLDVMLDIYTRAVENAPS